MTANSGRRDLPVVSLEEVVLFPQVEVTLSLARARSIRAVESGEVVVVLPREEALCSTGTIATVVSLFKPAIGPTRVLLRGTRRAWVRSHEERGGIVHAEVEPLADVATPSGAGLDATLHRIADTYGSARGVLFTGAVRSLSGIGDPVRLSYAAAGHVRMRAEERQALLEINDPWARLARVAEAMQTELDLKDIEAAILQRVRY